VLFKASSEKWLSVSSVGDERTQNQGNEPAPAALVDNAVIRNELTTTAACFTHLQQQQQGGPSRRVP
jgi:hypothetical protein